MQFNSVQSDSCSPIAYDIIVVKQSTSAYVYPQKLTGIRIVATLDGG